jgi:hypothetical protein
MSKTETTPLKKEDTATTATTKAPNPPDYPKLIGTMLAMLAVGFGLANGCIAVVGNSQKETYDSKIQAIKATDLQWLYLALVILGRTIGLLNFVPMGYKSGMTGNIRSNPFFFETVDDDKKTMVLFKQDGAHGMYNRANRSVQHMIENTGGFFAAIGPVGYVFPKQTCALVVVFCSARILHQRGYSSGYGGQAAGFILSTLPSITMEGLALTVFLKGQEIY